MTKVLFFVPALLPHTRKLVDKLRASQYEVDVYFLHNKRPHYPWAKQHSYDGKWVGQRKLLSVVEVAKRSRNSDVVIITGWHSWQQVVIAVWCFITQRNFAYWLDVPETTGPAYKRIFKKFLLSLSTAYLITSRSGFPFFVNNYGVKHSKCLRFPYLSAFDTYLDKAECRTVRKSHYFQEGNITVLIANRFLPRKGYQTVYRSVSSLPAEVNSRLRLQVLGHGYEDTDVGRKLASLPNVEMHGWVEFDEYLEKVKECDVYLHASDHEPYGIPPMDAMALGKVVICSDRVYSALDCIIDESNGFLFNAGDHADLARILTDIVKRAENLPKLAKKAAESEGIPSFRDHLSALRQVTSQQ